MDLEIQMIEGLITKEISRVRNVFLTKDVAIKAIRYVISEYYKYSNMTYTKTLQFVL